MSRFQRLTFQRPVHPVGNSAWPQGVAALANRTDRVAGEWVNANDQFYYAGDARDFSDFLKAYASVGDPAPGPPVLVLVTRPNDPFALPGEYDWGMNAGLGQVGVSFVVGRPIALKDLAPPPAGIRIEVDGPKTAEARQWLSHQPVSTQPTTRPG